MTIVWSIQPAAAVVDSERPFSDLLFDCGEYEWFAVQFKTTKHTDGGIYNDLENLSTEGFSALIYGAEIDFHEISSGNLATQASISPPVLREVELLSQSLSQRTVFPIYQDQQLE